ncbi:MAG: Hpt domain-containing protein [Oscillatoria princeps RMCB-10]|jgi:chemosensory pili system protein ChpA (sensor histidine kinase/response regulator)|nr:Hpt domain-containing protein [Oscillatoria princeps RMCB-10]
MQPEQQQEIVEEFVFKARQYLRIIEQGLLNLKSAENPELVNQILRAVSSVKVGADILGDSRIERTAARLQTCLENVRDSSIKVDPKLQSLLLEVCDALDVLVGAWEETFGLAEDSAEPVMPETEPFFEAISAHLALLRNQAPQVAAQPAAAVEQKIGELKDKPARPEIEPAMRVPVKRLDNLSNLLGKLAVKCGSQKQDQKQLRQSLDVLLNQVQQLTENFRASHPLSEEMNQLIDRIQESASQVNSLTSSASKVAEEFAHIASELQEELTSARMVPFAEIEQVFPLASAVRKQAAECGKRARVKIAGGETLIDRSVLEHFAKKLLAHLVNNAISHGIEPAEVREAAGKSPAGEIALHAFQQGNQTIISFSDDGAGIDVGRVRSKALEKGLISADRAGRLSRKDAYELLYHPGFTTRDERDLNSGLGVGMDAIRTELSKMGGRIRTDSTPGKGTTFTIAYPHPCH